MKSSEACEKSTISIEYKMFKLLISLIILEITFNGIFSGPLIPISISERSSLLPVTLEPKMLTYPLKQ